MTHLPVPRIESELLVLHELAAQLDEIRRFEGAARFVLGMIAPHAERHAITRVRQTQLAVGLLLTRDLRGHAFNLDVDARFDHGAVLRVAPDLSKRKQLHFL
jgi:hypothetical protein